MGRPRIVLKFHNYGQTPAYRLKLEDLSYAWGTSLDDAKVEDHPISRYLGPLGPGAYVRYFSDPLPEIQADQVKALTDKTLTFFVFGTLRYTDAFKKERHLKFRLMIGGETGTTEGESLNICQAGNETDDPD